MKAARTAAADSRGNDATKEFMVLPDTHAVSLRTTPTAAGLPAWTPATAL
jgi:hypothetical protein